MGIDIEELLSGESQVVEYKVERSASAKSYIKTVVAFANARGGTLVFGVDDKAREVVGVPSEKVFQDADAIANAIADSIAPRSSLRLRLKAFKTKTLFWLRCPLAVSALITSSPRGLRQASTCVWAQRRAVLTSSGRVC